MYKRITFLFLFLLSLKVLFPLEASAADFNSRAGIVATANGALNVRASASTGGKVIAALPKGSYVTLIAKSGSWWKVEYSAGKYGYCHADYIRTATGTPASVTASALNVRSGPSTSHRISGYLHKGDTLLVLSTSNGWSRVLYQGTKLGYVSSNYLSDSYSPVSLYLPNFKQTDSRWGSLTIGESGKTFAQIGCATTAIAMLESHRTGRTIYPHEMASQLRYTPTGSVYWPSHYSVVTSTGGYLSGIYNQLTQGKPVLLGVKNAYGSQHWVVVTGFTGGASLSPAAFTIHDPGTVNRTNLQQLLAIYPVFYKYFFY